jgi:hypothetical protein
VVNEIADSSAGMKGMKLVMRDGKGSAKKAAGEKMHSFTDALRIMHRSSVVAQIRQELKAHNTEHSGKYSACESSPCSQIGFELRSYIETAQEELDAPYKLSQARMAARNADPKAPDGVIEYRATLLVKTSPADDSIHPAQCLESPSDRIFNLKYPGLDFRGGLRQGALAAIAASYYLRFCKTGDPGILIEFIREHPIEFECSGWVLSASGRILLGMPRPRVGEERARILFRDYWKQIKHPKGTLSDPQLFVLAVASEETKRFSTERHRTHFKQAAMWADDQNDSKATFAAFRKDHHPTPCPCVAEINFRALKSAIDITARWSSRPAIANVLQEYVGVVCGIRSRTLRSWRSRRGIIQAKSRP